MPAEPLIRTITIQPEGDVAIEFVRPSDDIRSNGLTLNHVLFVPAEDDYVDGIDALVAAARDLLLDALEDHSAMPTWEPAGPATEEDDDDDD